MIENKFDSYPQSGLPELQVSTGQIVGEDGQELDSTLLLRTTKLIADGSEHLCILRRVTGTGVTLQLFQSRPKAASYAIEMTNGVQYPLEPDWSVGPYDAFRFVRDESLHVLINGLKVNDQRHELRLQQPLTGKLHVDEESCDVRFVNLSQQGACVTCASQLKLDQIVKIETDVLPSILAKVRWRQRPRYGLIFEQTFRFDELARRLAPDVWPPEPVDDERV